MMKKITLIAGVAILSWAVTGCAVRQGGLQRELKTVLSSDLNGAVVGVSIYHEQEKRFLYEQNEYTKLIPASNTKLLTTYAVLKYLPDSLPGWYVHETPDTLYIRPNADFTFLNRIVKEQRFYDKLVATDKPIVLNIPPVSNFKPLSDGWSKNAYRGSTQERSLMPIYSNVVRFRKDGDKLRTEPSYFERYLPEGLQIESGKNYQVTRKNPHNNQLEVTATGKRTTAFRPFTSEEGGHEVYHLLQDTLKGKTIVLNTELLKLPYQPFYTHKADDMLEPMMHSSNNFWAEQLLLMASSGILDNQISDHLAISKVIENDFKDFYDQPVWYEGSGLSRRNNMSPRFFISLLKNMKEEFSAERMRKILPQGKEGTLKDYYDGYEKYIYAKTGGLNSDVVALSGYLDTKKGNSVIFSFIINKNPDTRKSAHKAMERVLTHIIDYY